MASVSSAIVVTRATPATIRISPRPLLVVWTITLLFFRPSIFGEVLNEAAWLGLMLATVAIVMFSRADLLRIGMRRWTMFLLILATTGYFLFQGLLLSSATGTVINASVVAISSAICILLVCHPRNMSLILKTFIWVHGLLALSALVSLVWFALHGFDLFASTVAQSSIGSYDLYMIMPPFSLYWSWIQVFDKFFPRFVGIYREPGVAQTYFLTAYFLTYFVQIRWRFWLQLVLLASVVLIASTTGPICLVAGLVCLYLLNPEKRANLNRILPFLALLLVFGFLALFADQVGLLDKIHTASGDYRWQSYQRGIDDFIENPIFGAGYYQDFTVDESGEIVSPHFIGVFGVSYQIGLVGLLFYLSAWMHGLFRTGNLRTLCIYIPCLLTLFFAQPTYNDVLVWFLLLLDSSRVTLSQPFGSAINRSAQR